MARITPGSKGSLDDSKTWWKWSQFRMISSLHFVSYVHTNMLRNEVLKRQDENIDRNCKTNLRSAHFATFPSFTFNNDTKICTTLYSHPSGPATWQTAWIYFYLLDLHCPLCRYSIFEAKKLYEYYFTSVQHTLCAVNQEVNKRHVNTITVFAIRPVRDQTELITGSSNIPLTGLMLNTRTKLSAAASGDQHALNLQSVYAQCEVTHWQLCNQSFIIVLVVISCKDPAR